jgi:hypothetical protein
VRCRGKTVGAITEHDPDGDKAEHERDDHQGNIGEEATHRKTPFTDLRSESLIIVSSSHKRRLQGFEQAHT